MSQSDDLLSMTVRDFLSAAADRTATPGGGSVAALAGALGAALGHMAVSFTSGKEKFAEHQPVYDSVGPRLERAQRMLEGLVADDAAAYAFFRETTKMEASPERDEQMGLAVAAAIDVPREVTKVALAALEDLRRLADKCNPYLVSDLLAAAALSAAAVRLCDYNVRINARQLDDAEQADDLRTSSRDDLHEADRLRDEIESAAAID